MMLSYFSIRTRARHVNDGQELSPRWLPHFSTLKRVEKAHPSWPWHEEMIASMQHKTNVFNDLSGWSPRYIPESLLREAATRLQDRFFFGSDYPFITPQRWLKDFDALTYFTPEVREKILWRNAQKLLARTAVGQMSFSG